MKVKIIALLLSCVLVLTGTGGALSGLTDAGFRETPTAVMPAESAGLEGITEGAPSAEALADRLGLEYYRSEEEYRAKTASVAAGDPDTSPKTVRLTLTIEDRLTGDPIKNAVVRLNGVPRFSDRDGQVRLTLTNPLNELFVTKEVAGETETYNPYVEFLRPEDFDSEEATKTISMKRPSDDIVADSVLFEYEGERFNLLTQPCYVLKNETESYNELAISVNVAAESYMLLVNGKVARTSPDSVIEDVDFSRYDSDDEFAVRVLYKGIFSKPIPLQLYVDEYDPETLAREIGAAIGTKSEALASVGNEQSGIGSVGEFGLDHAVLAKMLTDWLVPKSASFEIGPVSIDLQFVFYPSIGELKVVVGFGHSFDVKAEIDRHKEFSESAERATTSYRKFRRQKVDGSEQEFTEALQKMDDCDRILRDKTERQKRTAEELARIESDREAASTRYRAAKAEAEESGCWDEAHRAREDFKRAKRAYTTERKKLAAEYEKDARAIENTKLDEQSAYRSLADYLKNGRKLKQQVKTLRNLFRHADSVQPSKSFGLDLDVSVLGMIQFSYRTGKVTIGELYGEVLVKPSFTYTQMVAVVPVFIKVRLEAGLKIFLIKHTLKEPFSPASFGDFLKKIQWMIEAGLRIDGGVGIPGIASAGPYGKARFDFGFSRNAYGKFQWGAGVRVQFLLFEGEWGYESPLYDLYGESPQSKMSLMARASAPTRPLSERQRFDRVYAGSTPRLLALSDGRRLLSWIADDPTRDGYNRSVLCYSLEENGVFGAPRAAIDDGTAIFAYDLAERNGRIFAAVQKSARLLTAADTPQTVLAASEIVIAEFDSAAGAFRDTVRLTANEEADANPRFAASDEQIEIVWESNTENDFFGLTGENVYRSARLTESGWTAPTELYRSARAGLGFSAATQDGALRLAVAEDADGDFLTDDAVITVIGGAETVRIAGRNPQFSVIDGAAALFFSKDGGVFESVDCEEASVVLASEGITEYFVGTDGGTPVILYEQGGTSAEQVFAAVRSTGGWTGGICVTDERETTNDVFASAGFFDGERIFAAYQVRNEAGEIVLCTAEKTLRTAFAVEAYAPDGIEDGGSTNLRIRVENTGDRPIGTLAFEVCGMRTERTADLAVGASAYFDVSFVASLNGEEAVTVTVRASGAERTVSVRAVYPKTDVEYRTETAGGKQVFAAKYRNAGIRESVSTFYVYRNGLLIVEEELRLSAGESGERRIVLDEIDEGDYIYMAIVTEEEADISDNAAGFWSSRTERKEERIENPYAEAMARAKSLLSGLTA